ncbi:MAG: sigma-54 dependent transcriptional regulator [Opitutales bacterium]|nr:sigma-54 dependent transcriptional regulator [Opitutales bacterium]NRA26606.1 sigma-54-dependent Fis family transcriptional regulator [Opitutales bacterium]
MIASLLIVDDEKHTREGLGLNFEDRYDVYLAANAQEAFNLMESQPFDVVLTDLRMAGKSGLTVIDKCLKMPNPPVCIMMTAYGSVDTAVKAMKRGAFDFLPKPVNLEKLEILIQRALESRNLKEENVQLHERLDKKYQFTSIVGDSPALNQVIETVKQVAPTKATVLLTGETGTGKELFAQAIHQNSERNRGPFLAVNCAALAANLLESELFGHEKGAFTGAMERRIGRFEAADGGTLFLDEIGEIDASTQVKLLRFLESRSFERLGSQKPIAVDVRLVFATNKNLADMVRTGDFREDLYYRLNVVEITLPPLREREEDIFPLLEHFIGFYAQENRLNPVKLTEGAVRVLAAYRWPGNIRELRNFCENLVVLKSGKTIQEYDLDAKYLGSGLVVDSPQQSLVQSGGLSVSQGVGDSHDGPSLSKSENEKRLLRNALMQARGNRTQAAELMGISRRTLHRKLLQWPELDPKSD